MLKKIFALTLCLILFTGCMGDKKETGITVFAAASLDSALGELVENYKGTHPDVNISINADSSGKLATQIKEGAPCDIFFSAATDKTEELKAAGLVKDDSEKYVLNNSLVLITYKDSGTEVKSLNEIGKAKSIALADGSVPAGAYTRQALMGCGILPPTEDVKTITTDDVSKALGGVEISEQGNVSMVLTAVAEGLCEVGTVYLSDTVGYEDRIDIIEKVDKALTGDIIYPAVLTENAEADEERSKAAEDFYEYITSDEANEIYEKYLFEIY